MFIVIVIVYKINQNIYQNKHPGFIFLMPPVNASDTTAIMSPITMSEALLYSILHLNRKHYANNAPDTSVGSIIILRPTLRSEALPK